jgi:hypothetical protein
MSVESNRKLVEEFWARMGKNDFRGAAGLLHDRYLLEWPQSKERVRGRENFVAINENYPAAGPWQVALRRIVAGDDGVVTEATVTDGRTTGVAITFSEILDNKIVHQVEYWPDPFEAAAWRSKWVERSA